MKYKRRRTNVSKYVSLSESKSKKLSKTLSLKKRSIIAVLMVITLFSLTRLGIINRSAVQSVFRENGVFDSSVEYITTKLSFLDVAGRKISDFCSYVFKNDKSDKTNAYATKDPEPHIHSSAEPTADSGAVAEAKPLFKPVNPCSGRISSGFGERVHPLSKEVSFHNGLDIAAPEGTEIRACFDGRIETCAYDEYSGNYIIIRHDDQYTSSYAHMSKTLPKKGADVKTGDIIGYVGSTGAVTGPHLHFEIRLMGTPLNPVEMIEMSQ